MISAVLCLSARASLQQSSPQRPLPDVQTLGPQVGSRVPDFTLSDQTGQHHSLQSLKGSKGLMLAFSRPADG